METLKPLCDFVIDEITEFRRTTYYDNSSAKGDLICKIENYAGLLKEPLNISMFVPAVFEDGEWVVLENPNTKIYSQEEKDGNVDAYEFKEYDDIKQKCYFNGLILDKFRNDYWVFYYWDKDGEEYITILKDSKIEDLLETDFEFKLTETLKNRLKRKQ